ncbi:MAG: DUF4007 family protein [Desulfovibrionales bacterium]|nr:DUF4007 family protein [Desulfovibrionales bacterium]
MKFNNNITAFGRHETFSLRYSWLTKGFNQFILDPKLFESDNATVDLGVGKNMVKSIRYWLLAAKLIHIKDKKLEATSFGKAVIDEKTGHDPYLEDEVTDWLIHWNLCTNPEQATSIFWFYNIFNATEFTADDVHSSLVSYLTKQENIRFTAGTIKNDVNVLLRMYATTDSKGKSNEDYDLISPVSGLKLIQHSSQLKLYFSNLASQRRIPEVVLGYAVLCCFEEFETNELALNELFYPQNGNLNLPNIFRSTEQNIMYVLEKLCNSHPEIFEIREHAGLRQLFLKDKNTADPITFLNNYYNTTENND